MQEVVIVSAARTPIGAYCGMLRDLPVEKTWIGHLRHFGKEVASNDQSVREGVKIKTKHTTISFTCG